MQGPVYIMPGRKQLRIIISVKCSILNSWYRFGLLHQSLILNDFICIRKRMELFTNKLDINYIIFNEVLFFRKLPRLLQCYVLFSE
jgi:hypothetical protein